MTAQHTRFYLVRHGPTHAKTMLGWTDRPADLTDSAALFRLRDNLPQTAMMISSDLIRATATADALQGSFYQRLPHDPNLRELNFGDWEDQTHAEVDIHSPELLRAFWVDAGDISPPNGDSWNQMALRVSQTIDRLAANHAGQNIVVVAHFGAILATVQHALQSDVQAVFAHRIENLSVTQLSYWRGQWTVDRINFCP
ncbi:MAG: alpha-ribazole phosphatase [Paracoccaceae bacterium]|jgi:alpha-ribazole phosphatase